MAYSIYSMFACLNKLHNLGTSLYANFNPNRLYASIGKKKYLLSYNQSFQVNIVIWGIASLETALESVQSELNQAEIFAGMANLRWSSQKKPDLNPNRLVHRRGL